MAYIFWVEAFFLSGGMSDLRTSQVSATIGGCVVRARPRRTKPGSRWPMAQLAKAGLLNSKYDHLPSSPCVSNWYSFHSLLDIAKPDGRWAMQLKVLADLNLWRPQSLCRLTLGMGSKHQVISSVNMIIHDPWVRLGQVFVHVEVDITWYHPVWDLATSRWWDGLVRKHDQLQPAIRFGQDSPKTDMAYMSCAAKMLKK